MRRILTTLLSAVPVAVALAVDAWAADLTVGSFNALHLGWGTDEQTTQKCTQIMALMETVDILLLQETMQPSVPCEYPDKNIVTWCSVMKGGTSYQEAYCAIYNSDKLSHVGYADSSAASFSRPPYAMFMKHKLKNRYIWLANIHSVYGKTVGPRQNEATAAGDSFVILRTLSNGKVVVPNDGFPVVFAGDWNLPVTNNRGAYNKGFSWVDPQTQTPGAPVACPTKSPTSLTTTGKPSSPYDHIIITSQTLTGEASCFITMNGLIGTEWRQKVSDHMAIYWGFSFK
jgi:hypothetical protein